MSKKRVLFFAEAVTLAHVVRPMVLAQQFDTELFDVHFAWNERYEHLFPDPGFSYHELNSISSEQFLKALADGNPVYNEQTLKSYVLDDLNIIGTVAPDMIIGDFRISLAISARKLKIPYLTISNAYWSPYVNCDYPIPNHPLVKFLGVRLAQHCFNLFRPLIFTYHCVPFNRVKKHFGVTDQNYDLRALYTDADYTLYADIPDMYNFDQMPANHQFIGPITWSPQMPNPSWWKDISSTQAIIYVTLGSSGAAELLPLVLNALGEVDVSVIVSTAGNDLLNGVPKNVYMADYINGDNVCKIADLVICNGGSPTTHQAIAQGVPVIGIASNLDQYLNMLAVKQSGAGILLRSDQFQAKMLLSCVKQILSISSYTEKAAELKKTFNEYQNKARLVEIVTHI